MEREVEAIFEGVKSVEATPAIMDEIDEIFGDKKTDRHQAETQQAADITLSDKQNEVEPARSDIGFEHNDKPDKQGKAASVIS